MVGRKVTNKASKTARGFLTDALETIEDRGFIYGDPAINHLRIAQLWSVYFERSVEPHDVAMAMALVKVARLIESKHHQDSVLDACAYLSLFGELAGKDWSDLDTY